MPWNTDKKMTRQEFADWASKRLYDLLMDPDYDTGTEPLPLGDWLDGLDQSGILEVFGDDPDKVVPCNTQEEVERMINDVLSQDDKP